MGPFSHLDYYPFGMLMPNRQFNNDSYRYAFNGKEVDNEIKGTGNSIDYGFRFYDPRVGRFLSIDPLFAAYPSLTPYQYASNTPIAAIDIDGLEALITTDYQTIEELKKDITIEHVDRLVMGAEYRYLRVVHKYHGDRISNDVFPAASEDELRQFHKEKDITSLGLWDKIGAVLGDSRISVSDAMYMNRKSEDILLINTMANRKKGFKLKQVSSVLWSRITSSDESEEDAVFGLTNSMRHITGQAIITFFTDSKLADFLGDRHELKKKGLVSGNMTELTTVEQIDTYVDLVNNSWGQKLGELLKKDYGHLETFSNEDAANMLNDFIEYFDQSWPDVEFKKLDPTDKKDLKEIKEFADFLNEILKEKKKND